jgi:SAM-dependent methyltransferase
VRTKIVPDEVLDLLKRNRHAYRAARRVRTAVGRVVPPRRFADLPGRVHFNDFMLEDDSVAGITRYRTEALNVLANVEAALTKAGRSYEDVGSWLDFGCGYGRVLRFLTQRVPAERISATDVIREGVDFCREEFGVHAFYSDPDVSRLRLARYDFVYAISVITHLSETAGNAFLQALGSALKPGGIFLFTTHGRWSLEHIDHYGKRWVPMQARIAGRVSEHGVAYEPYGYYANDDYGLAWHSERYVRNKMSELHGATLELLMFEPHGLDHHQDVFAYRRAS